MKNCLILEEKEKNKDYIVDHNGLTYKLHHYFYQDIMVEEGWEIHCDGKIIKDCKSFEECLTFILDLKK